MACGFTHSLLLVRPGDKAVAAVGEQAVGEIPVNASAARMSAGRRRGLSLLLSLVLCATILVGWFVWISPYGYEAPAGLADIDSEREHRVFVYGTLRQPLLRRLVTGEWLDARRARLPGFVRRGLDLEPAPGGDTAGEVLTVTAPVLARLDRYERLGIRYERVEVVLASGERAWVYLRLPD